MGTGAKFGGLREKRWCFANVRCLVSTFVLEMEATGMCFSLKE